MPVPKRPSHNPYLQPLPEDPSDRDERPQVLPGNEMEDAEDLTEKVADELSERTDPRSAVHHAVSSGPAASTAATRTTRKKPGPILTPKRPGLTGTASDYDKLLVILEEQVKREHDDWSLSAINEEAEKRYKALTSEIHPKFVGEYVRLTQCSWSPNRRFIRENIQVAACRRVPELAEIEELLCGHSQGRPSGRHLALAIFERCAFGNLRPELRMNYEDFTGSNLELDWAYFGTPDMEANTEHMREESVVRKAIKAMLKRHSPTVVLDANLALVHRIAQRHEDEDGFTDVGRYLAIDGTDIAVHVEQTVPVNAEHAEMIVGKTGAKFGFHGSRNRPKKHWVGLKLIVIMDLKTGLPLIWMLVPASDREFIHVTELLDELFRRAPWIDPEYLVGDSEYDSSTRLAFDLEQRYGIHPVFALRETVGQRWDWGPTRGVPQCSKHGAMKRIQAEDFVEWDIPIRHVRDFDQAKRKNKARIRWECDTCAKTGVSVHATTYPKVNARIYTYLPRGGDHKLYALRLALMARRNAVEGVFSTLKRRGIGAKKFHKAAWATELVYMEWLINMALFGMTLRREVHETDLYEQCAAEAWGLGLTKVKPLRPKMQTMFQRAAA